MKIRSKLLNKWVAWIIVMGLRLVFRMSRTVIAPHLLETGCDPKQPKQYLYPVWHDSLLVPIFGSKFCRMAALVSQHRDGTLLAEVMRRMNIEAVRGSSSRGGTQAMRKLISVAQRSHICLTPDGPRGPRRQLKDGVVFLASKTGLPIIPVVAACSRAWYVRGTWTNMLIPKPFSTTHVLGGEPVFVPDNLSREEVTQYTAMLQEMMDRLQAEADQRASGRVAAAPVTAASRAA